MGGRYGPYKVTHYPHKFLADLSLTYCSNTNELKNITSFSYAAVYVIDGKDTRCSFLVESNDSPSHACCARCCFASKYYFLASLKGNSLRG